MKMTKEELYLAAVASNLKMFVIHAFKHLNPSEEFLDNWHIDAIVYQLHLALSGKQKRLIINLPPRQLKSLLISVIYPAFILALDPTAKIICISYSDDLTVALADSFRRIVESEWYRKMFPHVRATKSNANEFSTDQGGSRFSTSVNGSVTGRGADFIIIDDPIKPEDTFSDSARDKVNSWFPTTVLSRLQDKRHSVLIIVMQRLHVNDLCGYALESGDYYHLALPAIAEEDTTIPISDTEEYFRSKGEVLHGEREDLKTLIELKKQIGASVFSAQYQQQPEPPDGVIFQKSKIQYIDKAPVFSSRGKLIVSIDTAVSTSNTADYTVITLIYSDHSGHYVLGAQRGHWHYDELKPRAFSYLEKYGNNIHFVIERANVGITLYETLKSFHPYCYYFAPRTRKVERAYYVMRLFEEGRVFFLNKEGQNGWLAPFINELLNFPHGKNDDQVDSLTQVLAWAEPKVNSRSRVTLC